MDNPPSSNTDSVFATKSELSWTRVDQLKLIMETWIKQPWQVLRKDYRGLAGILITSLFVFMGTAGVVIIPEPTAEGPIFLGPFESLKYPFGTNNRGIGMLSLIVHATPQMLLMILSGGLFATFIATFIGIASGYKRGNVDLILSAIADIALTIPGLPLIIVISFVFEPTNPILVGILLSINAWGGLARSIRSQVLSIRSESYVEASRAIGLSTIGIMWNDILPNLMPYISVNFVKLARQVIFTSVGLYFLGILPFSNKNWGVMINLAFREGAIYDAQKIHWLFIPMLTVIVISLGFLLMAQSLDRIFNPRARTRAAGDQSEIN